MYFSKAMLAATMIPVLSLVAANTQAGRFNEQGVYIGGSYGLLKVKDADEFDDDNNAYSADIGAKFNRFFGVEGSYVDFGSYGSDAANAETDGLSLSAIGSLPLSDFVSLYAKGGMLWWNTDYEVLGFNGDIDGNEPFYGVGASFALSDAASIQLDYTRYNVEFQEDEIGALAEADLDADIDHTSVGIQFLF